MDDENTESTAVAFPIGETKESDTYCVPCQRELNTVGALKIHNRWRHDEEGRKRMMAGAKKAAKNRMKDGKSPRLVGNIPNGSKLPREKKKTHECGFCDYPKFSSDGGLRYHLAREHKIHSIQANKDALAKKHAKQGTIEAKPQHRMPLAESSNPKRMIETTRSEVVATIEVVRIGSEVYGRIVTA